MTWMEMLLVGDLKFRLEQPHDRCKEELATIIATNSLEEKTCHFIPRHHYRLAKGWACRMCRDGIPVTGRGGYILGSELRDFYNVRVIEHHVSTDHWVLLDKLRECGA